LHRKHRIRAKVLHSEKDLRQRVKGQQYRLAKNKKRSSLFKTFDQVENYHPRCFAHNSQFMTEASNDFVFHIT